jgi:hypothetical protein
MVTKIDTRLSTLKHCWQYRCIVVSTDTLLLKSKFTVELILCVCSMSFYKCVTTHTSTITASYRIGSPSWVPCSVRSSHPPPPLATADCLTVSPVLPFLKCPVIGIMQYTAVQISFFHLLICIGMSSMGFHDTTAHSFLWLNNSTAWMCHAVLNCNFASGEVKMS